MTIHPGILQVAAFAGFPPFIWRQNDRACGADVKILEEFAASRSLKIVVRFFDFANLWKLPGLDVADVAASGLSLKMNRSHPGIAWSNPYSEVRRTALIRSTDLNRYTRQRHFTGARFAVVPDSAAETHARQAYPGLELVFCKTLSQGVRALQDFRVDAVGTGSISARHQLDQYPDLAAIDLHRKEDNTERIAFAVRRKSGLLSPLNAFIASKSKAISSASTPSQCQCINA